MNVIVYHGNAAARAMIREWEWHFDADVRRRRTHAHARTHARARARTHADGARTYANACAPLRPCAPTF
eukprot:2772332-Pleurochrysis_carterae.AAC.7